MNVSATRAITIGVVSLESALALFRDVMQLRVECDGEAPRSLLLAWGLGAEDRARIVELSCASRPCGRLRLIEYAPSRSGKVRDDFGAAAFDSPLDVGPKAIDFYVSGDVGSALERLITAGCQPRSKLRRHRLGQMVSEEVALSGPDGLPMLLMASHGPPFAQQPFSAITTASVICGDLRASRDFYGRRLGLVTINDLETPDESRALVNELVDVPPDTRVHFLLYGKPGEEDGKILLLHFFGRQGKRLVRRMQPGRLGFSMFSHDVEDVDALHAELAGSGTHIACPPIGVETLEGRRRLFLARGPNEELFEFSAPA